MEGIKVTNKFIRFNLIIALIIVVTIRFIFKENSSPSRYIKKFPIHLPH